MTSEEALIVIYRALRDSASCDIVYTEYNKARSEIYITLKENKTSYPFDKKSAFKASSEEEVWVVSKNDIKNLLRKNISKNKK